LIGPDYFAARLDIDPEELKRINPFDWKQAFPEAMQAGGFDCVIGNPPYVRIQTMKEWAPQEVEAYKLLFLATGVGNYDIYVLFVEKALGLMNKQGRLGYILPTKFFTTDYGEGLRKLISGRNALAAIVDFGHAQVFDGATTYTCLLFLSSKHIDSVSYVKELSPSTLPITIPLFRKIPSTAFTEQPWTFANKVEKELAAKILHKSIRLIDLPSDIGRGSSSGADDIFILCREGGKLFTRQGEQVSLEEGILRIPVYATDYGRYFFDPKGEEAIIFPYDVTTAGYELKSDSEFQKRYPKAYKYLASRKRELETRKQFKAWYSFSAPRNLNVHEVAQILVPLLADQGLYCQLPENVTRYCLMASGGFSITVASSNGLSSNYILGLLNSKLLFWRLSSISNVFRGGWITCTKQYVETLPIHSIDFSSPADLTRYKSIVKLVEQMIKYKKSMQSASSPADRELYRQQTKAIDAEIDRLVYELYGLTQEEIKIVEEGAKR
jgi:hypothetical protein